MKRNDVIDFARRELATEPEYLWARYPNYAVLRHSGSGRWYAVLMDIPRNRAGLAGEEKVDILDLRCGPILIGSLLGKEGYFPAYHMHKGNWVGVRLDGSVGREELCWLLRAACDQAGKGKAAARRRAPTKKEKE